MNQKVSIDKIKSSCSEVCSILKVLSHPQRLLILGHLLNGPKTVSDLILCTELSQSQMSQFLIRMKYDRLLKSERNGKFQVYSIGDKRIANLMKAIQNEYGSSGC
ncbi:MAG: winged helix-turn-helix transcriptional regulator [Deltaproteobacteria bacterium]|nr:winged helix-turn-helix transcriptional regulator [Deltaproteobacteria bacterium]